MNGSVEIKLLTQNWSIVKKCLNSTNFLALNAKDKVKIFPFVGAWHFGKNLAF